MFNPKNSKGVMALGGILSLALQVVAISTNNWNSNMSGPGTPVSAKPHMGLWKMCTPSLDTCVHLPPHDDKLFPKNSLYAVRVFALLSVLFLLASLMSAYTYPGKKRYCCNLMIMSSICGVIACAVWGTELRSLFVTGTSNKLKGELGYSWYLMLVGSVAPLVLSLYCRKN